MPSPDVRELVDLTLYDKDAQDIYDGARDLIAANFPDWDEDQTQLAVVFLQALALEVADLAVMVNRLPGAILECLLQLFSINRDIGSPPLATVTFTLADALGHNIPAGSRLRYDPGDGSVVDFTTDDELVIDVGDSEGTVDVTGTSFTAAANGVAIGTSLQAESLAYVDDVVFETSPVGGSGQEDDSTWMRRGIQTLARLVTTLVRPEHFTLAALDQTDQGVYRATTLSRSNEDGDETNGHVAVAVAGVDGALLSAPQKAAVLAVLQGKGSIEMTVHVIDAEITDQDVDVDVVRTPGYAAATVQANVTAALDGFLSPNTWAWGDTIRFYDLIALIEGVEGVDHITTLTTPAADVALTGVANLVDLGAVTVNVT